MKISRFIVFLLFVFSIYFFVNYYIFSHGYRLLPENSVIKGVYISVFAVFTLSFIIGRVLERIWNSTIIYLITKTGAFWLAAMLYFFLICILADLLDLLTKPFPETDIPGKMDHKTIILIISVISVWILIAIGYINAKHPRVKTLNLKIPKNANGNPQLRIIAVSDVHLGSIIGEKRVAKLVRMINQLRPDLVLFAGDLLDEDPGPVIHQNLGSCLEKIKAKTGIYAITGNHEYIGGVTKAVSFLERHGIIVLKDEIVLVNNQLYIAGREDRDMLRFTGIARKSLKSLLSGLDQSKPIIVLDHQPLDLNESKDSSADLQISGHTHHGQLWPLQYITKKIFELSWGYCKKGNTHYYVSSGYGTWGPPVRIGNRPEIVEINLLFTNRSIPGN